MCSSDLTSAHKRSFVDDVRKCEELSRVLRGVMEELQLHKTPMGELQEANPPSMADIEGLILEAANEIKALKDSHDLLVKHHNSLLVCSRSATSSYVTQQGFSEPSADMAVDLMSLSEFGESATSMLGQVYGVIKRESVGALERADRALPERGRSARPARPRPRSEEHTSELQSP